MSRAEPLKLDIPNNVIVAKVLPGYEMIDRMEKQNK